jgi:hypothetical protein
VVPIGVGLADVLVLKLLALRAVARRDMSGKKTLVRGAMAILVAQGLVGCAEGPAPTDAEPRVALRNAVARTFEARSFHIDGTIELAGLPETAEIDYVAPDRLRMVQHGESGSATRIVVGTNAYDSPASGAPFTVSTIPEFSLPDLITPLGALRTADDVKLVDGSYRFTVSDSIGQLAGEGEARVQGGVLESASLHFGKIEVRLTFSDYGENFAINAPEVDAAS